MTQILTNAVGNQDVEICCIRYFACVTQIHPWTITMITITMLSVA